LLVFTAVVASYAASIFANTASVIDAEKSQHSIDTSDPKAVETQIMQVI